MELLLPELGFMFWVLIAFLIVFFLLKKFAWKPIMSGLAQRESNINDAIASAEKIKLEMAQLKNDNERLLGEAREERAAMLKDAKETKDKMITEAKEEARIQATKILTEANAAIQNQKMAALTDIKNTVGKMVIEVSEKVLGKELSNKGEQEQFISQLASDMRLN